jgi:hypothetical protein
MPGEVFGREEGRTMRGGYDSGILWRSALGGFRHELRYSKDMVIMAMTAQDQVWTTSMWIQRFVGVRGNRVRLDETSEVVDWAIEAI